MPEEQQPESNPPTSQKRPGVRRRGHRGGRGRRRAPRQTDGSETREETGAPASQQPEKVQAAAPVGKSISAVAKAADEVRQVVESLEQALEQMEEVLELLETAERQKFADEREIESLRRALRRIQPPRGERGKDAGD
jgi:TolA-binding protein